MRRYRGPRRSGLTGLVLVAVAGGCSDDGAPPVATEFLDSASVRIATTSAEAVGSFPRSPGSIPDLVLGTDGDEVLFGAVGQAITFGSGQIAVSDPMGRQVHVFDEQTHLVSLGGAGSGPGEFGSLSWIGVTGGDSLLAFDARASRVSVFSPSGSFSRGYAIDRLPESGPVGIVGLVGGGELVVSARGAASAGGARADLKVWVVDREGRPSGEPFQVPGSILGGNGLPLGFGSGAVTEASDGTFWYAHQGTFSVENRDLDGQVRSIFRVEVTPDPVARSEVEAARAEVEASMRAQGASGPAVDRILATEYAEFHPVLGRLLTTSSGQLWASRFHERRYTADEPSAAVEEWIVFDESGAVAGEVRLPPGFRATHVDAGYVLGTSVDQLGRPTVQRYQLVEN